MAYDNMMTRAGTAAVAPEEVAVPKAAPAKHSNRHTQTGRFIRKGAYPIKKAGSKKR